MFFDMVSWSARHRFVMTKRRAEPGSAFFILVLTVVTHQGLTFISTSRNMSKLESVDDSLTLGRRNVFSAAALVASSSGPFASLLAPQPAFAEQAWQVKLPRNWQMFEQNNQPPPEVKSPVALVVAGNPDQGGELVVLRVPLSTAAGDPNAAASKDLIDYFNKGSTSAQKAVDALAASQKSQPGLTKFAFIGKPIEETRSNRRYLRYEYESSTCQGMVTKGVKGDTCEAPEDNSPLPLYERRHSITITVTDEGAAAAGQKDPTYFLWLLDASGPAGEANKDWGELEKAVKEVSSSFELADEATLEQRRTVEVTPEELEVIKQMQEAGFIQVEAPK